jgi:hypothetical protein
VPLGKYHKIVSLRKNKRKQTTTAAAALLFKSEQLQLLCMKRKRIYRNLNPQNSFNIAKRQYEVHQKTEKNIKKRKTLEYLHSRQTNFYTYKDNNMTIIISLPSDAWKNNNN